MLSSDPKRFILTGNGGYNYKTGEESHLQDNDFVLIKFDNDLNIVDEFNWSKTPGYGYNKDGLKTVSVLNDNSIIVTGYYNKFKHCSNKYVRRTFIGRLSSSFRRCSLDWSGVDFWCKYGVDHESYSSYVKQGIYNYAFVYTVSVTDPYAVIDELPDFSDPFAMDIGSIFCVARPIHYH